MAKRYSRDFRARAVSLFEDGECRREAARVLGLGAGFGPSGRGSQPYAVLRFSPSGAADRLALVR
jgi:hypothetical protein